MRLLRVIVFFIVLINMLSVSAQDVKGSSDSTINLSETLIQDKLPIIITDINISGNRKTKTNIVLRELPFQKGAHISQKDLAKQLVLARQQLMNTLLFVDVAAYISSSRGNEVVINIDVKERWYFFPLPYFRLVDRNFNQWWVEQHRSLERVNYGIKFTQNNTSGRNDELNIWLISGYTQQLKFRYNLPFFDKKLKSGFTVGFNYATQKELNYATADNRQLFYKQETIVKKLTRFDLTYSYRPDVKQRHYFRVSYNNESVADTVLKINPKFYPDLKSRIQIIELGYQYRYYDVDYIPYPTKGFLLEGNLYKRVFNNSDNLWQASTRAVYTVPVSKKSFLHFEILAMAKLPFNNYFYNERLFGYGFFQLRGLEYNVVDGILGGSLKSAIHKEVFSFILRNPFPSKTHDRIPIRFFLKAYGDLGYAYTKTPQVTNTLNNTVLRTWGFGMDIISIYDFVFKIEYSFNQLGRDGLYLQTRNDF